MELTKQVESEYVDEILEGLQKYWNYRANSYSKSNIEELNNFKRDAWLKILLENAPKKEKLRVLDMGAGPGFFSILMSLAGHEVTAVDVTEEMLENAKHNAKHFDLDMNFVQIDGVNLPFEDNSFDFIISRNVVWNLEYPKEVFAHGNISSEELMALEEIARQLVLSKEVRPAWDIKALKECGYDIIKVDENMGRYVWDEKQKLENKSRPLFMIVAK